MDKRCATSFKHAFSTRHERDFVALTAGYVDKSGKNKRNATAKHSRTSHHDNRLLPLTSEGGTLPTRLSATPFHQHMDADLRSIQQARDLLRAASEAQHALKEAGQAEVDRIVAAMAEVWMLIPHMLRGRFQSWRLRTISTSHLAKLLTK